MRRFGVNAQGIICSLYRISLAHTFRWKTVSGTGGMLLLLGAPRSSSWSNVWSQFLLILRGGVFGIMCLFGLWTTSTHSRCSIGTPLLSQSSSCYEKFIFVFRFWLNIRWRILRDLLDSASFNSGRFLTMVAKILLQELPCLHTINNSKYFRFRLRGWSVRFMFGLTTSAALFSP